MTHSTITSKGQTTIPAAVREALGVEPGDRVVYEVKGDRVVMRRHPGSGAVAGLLKGKSRVRTPKRLSDERTATRKRWANHAAGEGS